MEKRSGAQAGSRQHSAWRLGMAERLASRLDPRRFGVKALYVIGSTKNETAGPASDIDLLVRFDGSARQREDLLLWLEGWSLCLDEVNAVQTGCTSGGLLDVHLVTEEDVAEKSSYAVKIESPNDRARRLALKDEGPGITPTRG